MHTKYPHLCAAIAFYQAASQHVNAPSVRTVLSFSRHPYKDWNIARLKPEDLPEMEAFMAAPGALPKFIAAVTGRAYGRAAYLPLEFYTMLRVADRVKDFN